MNPKLKKEKQIQKRRFKMEAKGKERLRIVVIIVAIVVMVAGFIWFDNFQTVNGNRAQAAADQLVSSMSFLGQLPWSSSEYRLRAVLICDGAKIFVDGGKKYSTSALGCSYYLAEGIDVKTVTNVFNAEGSISFRPVSDE